ncbi:MAG TPA: hypothetical protein DCR21_03520 [Succinivibrionaceae bacterium]|nr:hypothetical protein [Succinivibrionaceae bacterium]
MIDSKLDSYILEKYFKSYNRDFQKLSESSIKHYCEAIKKISQILRSSNKVQDSLYEITDLNELDDIRQFLDKNQEYQELDERGHRMYSCGFKKYYEFATASGFEKIGINISDFDNITDEVDNSPVLITDTVSHYKRSTILKNQVMLSSHYLCEINKKHTTFTAKASNKQYMEGHHIIPIKYQKEFKANLDVYSNIICLCPICHRLLHYGIDSEKEPLLTTIYSSRKERLNHSGIVLTKDDFLDLTLRA